VARVAGTKLRVLWATIASILARLDEELVCAVLSAKAVTVQCVAGAVLQVPHQAGPASKTAAGTASTCSRRNTALLLLTMHLDSRVLCARGRQITNRHPRPRPRPRPHMR
jgi:hypothetical protein